MIKIAPDTELEYELQELYILAKHWLHDISFAEDEIRFFNKALFKYKDGTGSEVSVKSIEFSKKIAEQEQNIVSLKIAIPQFLAFLQPYIGNLKKVMDLHMIEKYNSLDNKMQALFADIKLIKIDLLQSFQIL